MADIKKIAVCVLMTMAATTMKINAQNLSQQVASDGARSIAAQTFKKAQVWRTEEFQVYADCSLTEREATLPTGEIVKMTINKPERVYGPMQSVAKDGFSVAVGGGLNYMAQRGAPEFFNNFQPQAGISFRADGIGWCKTETETRVYREVYGYAIGETILMAVMPWEWKGDMPSIVWFERTNEGYFVWLTRPQGREVVEGHILYREVEEEVPVITSQHRPFAAELAVSGSFRRYEPGAESAAKNYISYSTTLYLKYRLFEDKWLRHRLNLVGSAGYLFGKDDTNVALDKEYPMYYMGSGITFGGGLEYRFQFPATINKAGKINKFMAGSALNLYVGAQSVPIVTPGYTRREVMVMTTLSWSFGMFR